MRARPRRARVAVGRLRGRPLRSPGALTTYSMDYVAPNDVQAADDFTIPAGQQWTITEVDVLGSGGSFETHIRIYSNVGGLPGTVLFDGDKIVPTNKRA